MDTTERCCCRTGDNGFGGYRVDVLVSPISQLTSPCLTGLETDDPTVVTGTYARSSEEMFDFEELLSDYESNVRDWCQEQCRQQIHKYRRVTMNL